MNSRNRSLKSKEISKCDCFPARWCTPTFLYSSIGMVNSEMYVTQSESQHQKCSKTLGISYESECFILY